MKMISLKSFSFLSLMLIITSTIVAAITRKEAEIKRIANGRLFVQSNDGPGGPLGIQSCALVISGVNNCTATVGSATTSIDDPSSSERVGGLNKDTMNNTSVGVIGVDSILEAA